MTLLVLASSGAAVASASPNHGVAPRDLDKPSSVKPDLAYYAGKTVTFITGGSPGGSNDELALILAPLMASYLHCTINVEDIPAGATVPAQDDTAASPPNGLTFGQGGPIGDVENEVQNIADVNFNILKVAFIGGVSPQEEMAAAVPSSGIRSLTQLVDEKSPYKLLALSGGGELIELVMQKAYNLHATLVYGYSNGATLQAGFLRGDGTATWMAVSGITTAIQDGLVVPLAMSVRYPKGSPLYSRLSKLPTLAEWVASHPPKTRAGRKAMATVLAFTESSNQVLFAAEGTPPALTEALSDAFHSALEQPSTQTALIDASVPNGYFSASDVAAQVRDMVKNGPSLLPYL